jgi:hypothetical protein
MKNQDKRGKIVVIEVFFNLAGQKLNKAHKLAHQN